MYTNSNYRALLCVAMKGISIWSASIDYNNNNNIINKTSDSNYFVNIIFY